jgi:hypothetical protein
MAVGLSALGTDPTLLPRNIVFLLLAFISDGWINPEEVNK